jgi:hypothetical protein
VPGKKDKQPLSVTHPELAKEAEGWDPTTVTAGSGKKMLWKCRSDHQYESSVSHRTNMKSGCPYCSGQKALEGFNDLATKFPELAKEADGWDPKSITFGSGKRLKWKCPNKHSYFATISNRTHLKGTGCPVCANKVVQPGFNDLESKFPELAKEADGWDPKSITFSSNQKQDWICSNGHKFRTAISSRTGPRKTGCSICSNRVLLQGYNDLTTTHPEVSFEAHGWDTSKYFGGSHEKLPWKCSKGHIYEASVSNRTSRGSGCPVCSGRKVEDGFNDLATKFPLIATEAFGWDPSQISAGSHKKMTWKCPQGHLYEGSIAHRTSKDSRGCPICVGKQIQVGFNDLASRFPEIAKEADGWDPVTVTAGIDTKMNWTCPVGHKYSASVGSRTNQRTGCSVCANMQLLKGFNDLRTKFPSIAIEAFDWDPSDVLAGSKKKMKWKCPSGHIYIAPVSRRTKSKSPSGCPKCGKYGFDPTQEGYLYLVTSANIQMQQIGITNDPARRLKEHDKTGWKLLEIRGPMDGYLTRQWETAILRMLKAKGADLSNSKIAGKFDGYSEAWSRSTFEVKSIKELMRLTEEFEESN